MPGVNIAEFEKMMDEEKSDEELQKFVEEKIPDITALVAVDLAHFKDVYLGK
jgi:fatty acid-binding protein DegV